MYRALLLLMFATTPLAAQRPQLMQQWNWQQLRMAPTADTAKVNWLEANLTAAQRDTVIALVSALSQPEAAQLLPHFTEFDGTTQFKAMTGRGFLDSLRVRPPGREAGAVHVAYFVSRARAADLAHRAKFGTYRASFTGQPFAMKAHTKLEPARNASVRLSFNAAPAESLLAIVAVPNLPAHEIMPRISTQAFDYMVFHHNQSFYSIPTTREQLALSLAAATSTDPLSRLYRHANPRGLYHFTDVALNRTRYTDIIRTLKQNESAIAERVNERLAPFVPPGTNVSRTLTFYFGDGSDGWAVDTVAAVVLEYYKDDYEQMLEVTVHELFHLAQSAVTKKASPQRDGVAAHISSALGIVLTEGTANYIAPAARRTPDERMQAALAGVALLDTIANLPTADRAAAQPLINRGVAGGGPFYWLGGLMSEAIVRAYGPQGLAATLQEDGVAFFGTYTRAIAKLRTPSLFGDALTAKIGAL